MEPKDPPPRRAGEPEDVLRRLEERLGRASEAAERLMSEAARSASSRPRHDQGGDAEPHGEGVPEGEQLKPPPAGWQVPQEHRRESDLLVQAIQSLRELIPPELQQRLLEALREVLLALRALLDWYLERLERRRAEPAEVEDIPIR